MKTWKERKGVLTSESRAVKSDGIYEEDRAYNYLWELLNLGDFIPAFLGMRIFKDGFARFTYKKRNGNGVESRVIQTLAEMERSFGIPKGKLEARVIMAKENDFDTTLSAEQFFHSKNRRFRLAGLFRDLKVKGKRPVGGHSEFFNMPIIKAKSKFANAWRQTNLVKGLEIVEYKRENGIYGCPTPDLPNYEEDLK
jgi:hypothetical protein